jgi:NADH:ubiquinone oxidoreductase subunit 5 (subunit L)/multisubunit Na+/H+ antiporter MnhA subunit
MNVNLRKLVLPAVILGVALIVVAVVYFVTPAHSLPSFFPGHVSASSSEASHHHAKHGIAALILALACFAFAWFQTGPKTQTGGSGAQPGDSEGAQPRPGDSEGEHQSADRA